MTKPPKSSRLLRLALRAYPRRWREARQSELLDVLRDTVPDRPNWPGAESLLDLVVGGWRTRWRMHPPFRAWLGYRFLDRRLAPEWNDWARSDITGWWWSVRRLAPTAIILATVGSLSHGFIRAEMLGMAVVILPVSLLTTRRVRRKLLAKHLLDAPRQVWTWVNSWVEPPRRHRALPVLATAGVTFIVMGPVAAWVMLQPSSGRLSQAVSFGTNTESLGNLHLIVWSVVGASLALAVVALLVGRRRMTARFATRRSNGVPAHRLPARRVAALIAAQLVGEAVICTAQLAGVIPGVTCLSVVVAGACIGPLLLGVAVVARRSERQLGVDVTWHDCLRALFGSADVLAPELGRYVMTAQLVPATAVAPGA